MTHRLAQLEIRPIFSALLRHKSSALLIILQIALTFAVLVNSISIINQRLALMARESGLDEQQLVTLNISVFGKNYDFEQNIRADVELLRKTPGVVDAIAINQVPLSGSGDSGLISSSQENFDNFIQVGAGFFSSDSHLLNTLGVTLISGRDFTEEEVEYTSDRPNAKVVIITQSLARKLFGDASPLGKKVFLGGDLQPVVIGVIEKMLGSWVHNPIVEDNILFPYVALSGFKRILIRTENKAATEEMLGKVEQLLNNRNDQRVIFRVRSLTELRKHSYSQDIAMSKILWLVISLLVLLTALGIVGIVSFNINQRTKQIGTRRALGATQFDIQRYFITENILLSIVGLTLGAVLAILFNIYLVDSYAMSPLDWYLIPYGIILMTLVGIASVWYPAKKASNISPAIATQSI